MRCRCDCISDFERAFYKALAYSMVTEYFIFRKDVTYVFGPFSFTRTLEEHVEIPKNYCDNYEYESVSCLKRCINLVDRGYHNDHFTEERIQMARERIANYQMVRNEVWE